MGVGECVVDELVPRAFRRFHGKQFLAIVAYSRYANHLHFLARGRSADSDLMKLVSVFKQETGCEYQKRFGRKALATEVLRTYSA